MGQEYLLFSDLQALNSSPDDVRNKFTTFLGERPEGIALNTENYYNAVTPPITVQYDRYCFKDLHKIQYSKFADSAIKVLIGTGTAKNTGDEDARITIIIATKWDEVTNWSSSITPGISFNSAINLEGTFSTGMPFSASVKAGVSGSSKTSNSSSTSVTVKVPPKSKVEVQVYATVKKEIQRYNATITIHGFFGANFLNVVRGQKIYFLPEYEILSQSKAEFSGQISGEKSQGTSTVIGNAQPL